MKIAKLPLWLRSSPTDCALTVGGGPARGLSFEKRGLARLGTRIRMQTHFIFGESHRGRLLALTAPL
jgi:hypothetical protein